MKTRAAVAWKAGAPLTIETVDLEGPKVGEVLVDVKATGICHTDHYTLSGADRASSTGTWKARSRSIR
jgi:S-(hydroxymethyl)glutathione dehydrogenase/alcohol dehydrogenase